MFTSALNSISTRLQPQTKLSKGAASGQVAEERYVDGKRGNKLRQDMKGERERVMIELELPRKVSATRPSGHRW